MSTSTWTSLLPFQCDVARKHCVAALHMAGFRHIDVTSTAAGGFLLTATRRVAGQWTRTTMTVTIAPHGTSSAVGAYASATPQSLISLFRSPSRTVILKFLDSLFPITGTTPKRWMPGQSNAGGIALGIAVTVALILMVVGVVVVGSSWVGDRSVYQSVRPDQSRIAQPSRAPKPSASSALPERGPAASVVVQAITQLGATVRLTSRANSEQVVEVTVDFIADDQILATGSSIVRLSPGEESYVNVEPKETTIYEQPFEAVIRTIEVLQTG